MCFVSAVHKVIISMYMLLIDSDIQSEAVNCRYKYIARESLVAQKLARGARSLAKVLALGHV